MQPFTVIVLYPDYLQASGSDTFCECAVASTPDEALSRVQQMAAAENEIENPLDFALIAVFAGDLHPVL